MFQEICPVTCNKGYVLSIPSASVLCTVEETALPDTSPEFVMGPETDGIPTFSLCVSITCLPPPPAERGSFTRVGDGYGSTDLLSCDPGWMVAGALSTDSTAVGLRCGEDPSDPTSSIGVLRPVGLAQLGDAAASASESSLEPPRCVRAPGCDGSQVYLRVAGAEGPGTCRAGMGAGSTCEVLCPVGAEALGILTCSMGEVVGVSLCLDGEMQKQFEGAEPQPAELVVSTVALSLLLPPDDPDDKDAAQASAKAAQDAVEGGLCAALAMPECGHLASVQVGPAASSGRRLDSLRGGRFRALQAPEWAAYEVEYVAVAPRQSTTAASAGDRFGGGVSDSGDGPDPAVAEAARMALRGAQLGQSGSAAQAAFLAAFPPDGFPAAEGITVKVAPRVVSGIVLMDASGKVAAPSPAPLPLPGSEEMVRLSTTSAPELDLGSGLNEGPSSPTAAPDGSRALVATVLIGAFMSMLAVGLSVLGYYVYVLVQRRMKKMVEEEKFVVIIDEYQG
eukprot:gnl/TRDRNA2_/TRDRNA2_139722_c3_seq1.p1 gnl/TRDRNA2_/TRDRNA2_139722_c3~~gnl/TRDRNA2_/TRDRNA2_139722_c3_seq1.p1  ORF type:complete len:582 (+),score=101.76 gnl/TRDRNA2_/TRDRNA2_139722_c3_seq1:229-1746(+)